MQRLALLCLIAFGLLALPTYLSGKEIPPAPEPERFQLVGFTNATFTGDSGVLAFTRACQVEFPTSRMCSTEEVAESVAIPADLSGTAWVRPEFKGYIQFDGSPWALDAGGRNGPPSDLTCRGWSSASDRGYTVDADGRFGPSLDCNVSRPITCCALTPQTIRP